MQGRHGREAQRVVDRAIELSGRLPPELQEPMQRAIIDVLNEKMHAYPRSRAMQTSQLPLGPAAKLLWDEAHAEGQSVGRGEGKAEAILAVLAARGIGITSEQRAMIAACHDNGLLDRYLQRAAIASTFEDLLR